MLFFFFNDTATTEIYTLSLHDALPICYLPSLVRAWSEGSSGATVSRYSALSCLNHLAASIEAAKRSEEHTSELQSRQYLVCRLLLEKKKTRSTVKFNAVMKL